MLFRNKYNKVSEKTNENVLLDFVKNGGDKINVISPLNSGISIFYNVFQWAIENHKKIIYILSEENNISKLVEHKYISFLNFVDIEEIDILTEKINICTYNLAIYIQEKFDVVIYDEVNSRPRYSNNVINRLVERLTCNYGTMIGYSMEQIFQDEETIYNLKKDFAGPIIEPRVITTRVNLEQEIPLYVYDYIKWSINTNKKIVIYVPGPDKVDKLYNYLYGIKEMNKFSIYKVKSIESGEGKLKSFLTNSMGILITDELRKIYLPLKSTNIMVLSAEHSNFTYKDLVYISSKIRKVKLNQDDEVIFICNSETQEIERCKTILREINKKLWEVGLLKL